MNTRFGRVITAALLIGLLIGALGIVSVASASNLERSGTPPASAKTPAGGMQRGMQSGTTLVPLSAVEVDALEQAIDEEYLALNTYRAVLTQLGSITPFSRVALSEQQHVAALSGLFAKYSLATPANPGLDPTPVFANRRAACQAGVDVEIADAALYDVLLPIVKNHADLVQVFTNLQAASLTNHLPAFDGCN